MGLRAMVVLFVAYVVQLTLYFVGTIVYNVSATDLLNLPKYGSTPGLGTFLSNMNLEIQGGLAVEGLVLLSLFFVAAFRRRGDTGRL